MESVNIHLHRLSTLSISFINNIKIDSIEVNYIESI